MASSLADAGHKVAVTGFLGRENATVFERLFARKRISDHFVRLEGETRVGIKITDPVLKETTDINFPGAEPLPSDLAALRSAVDQIDAEWFVIAGSLPPGVETTIYRDLTQSLKTRGRKVALDTSGETLNHAIEALPAFIKPNIHELEGLVGRALPSREAVVAAARELVARGIEMVVVSMGEQGACFIGAEGVIFATPPAIEVRSTVGAGDAMVAGVLSAKLAWPSAGRRSAAVHRLFCPSNWQARRRRLDRRYRTEGYRSELSAHSSRGAKMELATRTCSSAIEPKLALQLSKR